MCWSFAIVNGQLAEIFWEREEGKLSPHGHAYVKRSEYRTKQEQRYIDKDIEKYRFVYRKGEYKSS
ncbi:MAG: hypothetical protein WC873_01670 [Candidatus Gracilibacteria bacterium]